MQIDKIGFRIKGLDPLHTGRAGNAGNCSAHHNINRRSAALTGETHWLDIPVGHAKPDIRMIAAGIALYSEVYVHR